MLLGHYRPVLALHFGLFGCMMIAGTAGLLYARDLARGYVAGALGGLVIGAACGLAAVGTANLLGDQPDLFIPYGVMVCTLIGAIGGLFGQYARVDTRLHRDAAQYSALTRARSTDSVLEETVGWRDADPERGWGAC